MLKFVALYFEREMNGRPKAILLLTLIVAALQFAPTSSAAPSSSPLNITNTVGAKTTFKIFRRRPDNNHWDTGAAFSFTNGIALLKALETSKPWEDKTPAYGGLHGHIPAVTITIDWSHTRKERKTHSITLCYGNRLFWYGDSVYEVPKNSYEVIDKFFPKNR